MLWQGKEKSNHFEIYPEHLTRPFLTEMILLEPNWVRILPEPNRPREMEIPAVPCCLPVSSESGTGGAEE